MKTLCAFLLLSIAAVSASAAPIKALIIDGQNNHEWQVTTPHLKSILEQTGLFHVDVATTPPKGGDLSGFRPTFSDYGLVISNYMGDAWPAATQAAFVDYVRGGGGFVVVHSADNAFPAWKDYNAICGLGGWEGRNEQWGPYVYWDGTKIVRDPSPGPGGSHGNVHAFQVVIREPDHPITHGLPTTWMHAADELYNRLRGPAENLTVLATAYDDPANRGSGRHEPILFTVTYGQGRIFHTPLGHVRKGDLTAMRCVGFIVTLQRGAEWAATGRVTQALPADFPQAETVSLR
ncbi:ThuA domain-containing protein [Opitutus terrae]|uniref:ThuA-like domain-containing protein n=1 Tax=Opitutus terrae (strain DSM 11246 / JCM 15787 / PB90-1) TaxID=452637 RepID=B1ZQQ8_OPITP|nr:ThuA domain-containing protein [Opitutus terrae]ACB77809.1 conserved hypothetical protein [Opitutus terrae PB90-1]